MFVSDLVDLIYYKKFDIDEITDFSIKFEDSNGLKDLKCVEINNDEKVLVFKEDYDKGIEVITEGDCNYCKYKTETGCSYYTHRIEDCTEWRY